MVVPYKEKTTEQEILHGTCMRVCVGAVSARYTALTGTTGRHAPLYRPPSLRPRTIP